MAITSLVRAALAAATIATLVACGGGGGDSASPPAPAAPSVAAQPQPLSVSEGALATFTVSAAGGAPFTYQWQRNGIAIAGATSSSYSTPRTTLSDSGALFRVVVSNTAGNVTSSAAPLTVLPKQWQAPQLRLSGANNDGPVKFALDARGNGIALWVRNDAGRFDLMASHYDAAGATWAASRVLQADAGNGPMPALAFDTSSNAIALWHQRDISRFNILASRYSAATDSWSAPLAIESGSGDALDAQIVVDAAGNATAAWRQFDGAVYSIAAARYAATSGVWSAESWIETHQAGDSLDVQLAVDGNGNVFAVWRGNEATRRNIWANRYDASSGQWGSAGLLENADGQADTPRVVADAAGNTIAVWSQVEGSRYSLWASRYVAANSAWSAPQLIETENAGDAVLPKLTIDAAGNAVAAWEQFDGSRWNILANRFDATSMSWGSAKTIETNDSGSAREPQVAIDGGGNAIVVWEQPSSGKTSIWANRFRADLGAWGTAQLIKSDDGVDAEGPQIAVDGNGNAIALWFRFDASGAVEVWSASFR